MPTVTGRCSRTLSRGHGAQTSAQPNKPCSFAGNNYGAGLSQLTRSNALSGLLFSSMESTGVSGLIGSGGVGMKTESPITITIEPLAVDVPTAARLIGLSRSHFLTLEKQGFIGPRPIENLGKRCLYSVDELRRWTAAGMPRRSDWQVQR